MFQMRKLEDTEPVAEQHNNSTSTTYINNENNLNNCSNKNSSLSTCGNEYNSMVIIIYVYFLFSCFLSVIGREIFFKTRRSR